MASYSKYYTKDGIEKWKFQIYAGINHATGKKRGIQRRSFSSLADAKKAARRLEAKIAKDDYEYEQPSKMYMRDYLRKWLKEYKTDVKEGSMIVHRYNVEHYIIPAIGNFRLDQYNSRNHQDFINSLFTAEGHGRSGHGLSWATVQVVNGTLSNALHKAVKLGFLETNPTSEVEFPKKYKPTAKQHKLHYYTVEQTNKFLEWSTYHGDPLWYPFFLTIFDAGLRKGEVMARKWGDINFRTATMNVTTTRLYRAETTDTIAIDDPKTDHSLRKVPLTPRLNKAFQDYYQLKYPDETWPVASTTGHVHNDDFIFTYVKGISNGKPVRGRSTNTAFERIRKNAGLPKITVHDGRHTNAVHLRQAGVPLEDIQDLLGHVDPSTTKIYAEITPEVKEKAIQKLDDFYSKNDEISPDSNQNGNQSDSQQK